MIIRANPFPIFPKWIQIKNKKKKEQRYTITAPYHIEYDLQKKTKLLIIIILKLQDFIILQSFFMAFNPIKNCD